MAIEGYSSDREFLDSEADQLTAIFMMASSDDDGLQQVSRHHFPIFCKSLREHIGYYSQKHIEAVINGTRFMLSDAVATGLLDGAAVREVWHGHHFPDAFDQNITHLAYVFLFMETIALSVLEGTFFDSPHERIQLREADFARKLKALFEERTRQRPQ